MAFIGRFFNPPPQSYFLLGPRGTGKSLWTMHFYPEAVRIDLLQADILRRFKAKPERIRDLVHAEKPGQVFIIDEVQKVPEILGTVHSLIEEKKEWLFVLTGSSARKLKQSGVDLMAGRALIKSMHPFMAAELGGQFTEEKALELGMLPLIIDNPQPQEILRSYIDIYLKEEILTEGLIRNLGDFSRFLEVISFSHAQILNVSNIARECEVHRKTVEGYLSVLKDLLLSFTLPVFSKRAARKTVAHEKFYLFDTGVYRSLRPQGPLDSQQELSGPSLEGFIAQHLQAWIDYGKKKTRLYYWRTRGGSEIDFILYGPDLFYAIEVKHSDKIHRTDLRGLKAFRDDYPEAKTLLLYRGKEKIMVDDILCVPCGEFLKNLYPGKELPFWE